MANCTVEEVDELNNLIKIDGRIRKIHIRNFVNFEGDHTIDLCLEDGDIASIVALVGHTGTGKGTVLKCLSTLNILKQSYERVQDEAGKFQALKERRDDQFDPLECENTCPYNTSFVCPKFFDSCPSLERILVDNQTHACHISKKVKDMEGFFIVEAVGISNIHPIYYGLYSDKSEHQWSWHCKDQKGHYIYSTAFLMVFRKKISVYILSPCKVNSPQENEILQFDISRPEDIHLDVIQRLIEDSLRDHESCQHYHSILPSIFRGMFPSNVITFYVGQMAKTKHDVDFVDQVLSSSQNLETSCILMKNAFYEVRGCYHNCDYLQRMLKHCQEKKVQIMLSTHSGHVMNSYLVPCLVHFTERLEGKWTIRRPPAKFITECENKHLSAQIFLEHSVILLVEGWSDEMILKSLLDPYNWRGRLGIQQTDQLEAMLRETYVLQVNGKDNIHSILKFLFSDAQVGLFQFIVCDADALWGGSAKERKESEEDKLKMEDVFEKSVVLKCTDSILSTVTLHFDKCQVLQTVYSRLAKVRSGNSNVDNSLDQRKDMKISIIEMVKNVAKENCRTPKEARSFSEHKLHTFAWKVKDSESCLESVINLTSTKKYSVKKMKSRISSNSYLCRKIAEEMVDNRNVEIIRLFAFLKESVVGPYQDLQDVLSKQVFRTMLEQPRKRKNMDITNQQQIKKPKF